MISLSLFPHPSLPRENTVRRLPSVNWEEASHQTQDLPLGAFGHPASRTGTNECLLFKSLHLWFWVIAA